MLSLKCACGASHDVPESFVGENALCLQCGHALYVVAGGAVAPSPQSRVGARLQVLAGPARVGEQFFPVGPAPVEIGKLPQNAICLAGSKVSRNHCQLVRRGSTWRIEDLKSTNGLLVNEQRVRAATLRYGDVIQVGDFRLRFDTLGPGESGEEEDVIELGDDDLVDVSPDELVEIEDVEADDDGYGAYDLREPLPPPAFMPTAVAIPAAAVAVVPLPAIPIDGPPCPCCEKTLPRNAKVCVECGIRVPSGRPLIISRGMDEDDTEKQDKWIDVISWIVPLNLIPIGSEAFGAHKGRAVWYITAITVLVSLWFLVVNIGAHGRNFANLELWAGSREASEQLFAEAKGLDEDTPITRAQAIAYARAMQAHRLGSDADFHPYQLLTNALLHGGIFHLAGNLVFLIVFGKRVNEAIGDLAMGIVYPLLAISASAIYLLAMSSAPLHAALGASGAIMGLAGMYFVFFPVQRVHLAFWFRLRVIFMYRKIFRPRGFWLLVVWVLWNDVLPVLLGTQTDGVAHWAHLGGFLTGMAIAIILLVSRLGHSMGGDLLSVCLGKHAWPLIGKPNRWLGEVVPDMTPRPRRIVASR